MTEIAKTWARDQNALNGAQLIFLFMERVKGDINIFVQSSSIFVIQNFLSFFFKGLTGYKVCENIKTCLKSTSRNF